MTPGAADIGIDVVVPARDAAATLQACLDAILGAGFAPAAIIVADDQSTDATPGIAAAAGARVVRLSGAVGAAEARNRAAAAGSAPIILFVDADVALHPGAQGHVRDFFRTHPSHAGLIGSYDDSPPAPGTLSRIRNLLHHHTHKVSAGDVPSFWTGCGAIRRADFEAAGGFERGHALEDVALGLALARMGRAVRLDPNLECTHLKRWTLRSMVRADLLYRALPWSRMLLDPRNAQTPAALNAGRTGKMSVVLSVLALCGLLACPLVPLAGAALALAALVALALLHRDFLHLIEARLGRVAALQAVGVLVVHFLCAAAGFAWALTERTVPRT